MDRTISARKPSGVRAGRVTGCVQTARGQGGCRMTVLIPSEGVMRRHRQGDVGSVGRSGRAAPHDGRRWRAQMRRRTSGPVQRGADIRPPIGQRWSAAAGGDQPPPRATTRVARRLGSRGDAHRTIPDLRGDDLSSKVIWREARLSQCGFPLVVRTGVCVVAVDGCAGLRLPGRSEVVDAVVPGERCGH